MTHIKERTGEACNYSTHSNVNTVPDYHQLFEGQARTKWVGCSASNLVQSLMALAKEHANNPAITHHLSAAGIKKWEQEMFLKHRILIAAAHHVSACASSDTFVFGPKCTAIYLELVRVCNEELGICVTASQNPNAANVHAVSMMIASHHWPVFNRLIPAALQDGSCFEAADQTEEALMTRVRENMFPNGLPSFDTTGTKQLNEVKPTLRIRSPNQMNL